MYVNIYERLDDIIRPTLIVEVKDRLGTIIRRDVVKTGSWVRNFAEALMAAFSQQERTVIREDGNSAKIKGYLHKDLTWACKNLTYNATLLAADAGAGDDSYGIVVGSGSDPEDFEQYALSSKITHGSGSGQLEYGSMNFTVTDPLNFALKRAFTNYSGGDIQITEVALVVHWYAYINVDGTVYDDENVKFMILRTLLSEPVTVPDGGSVTVTISIQLAGSLTDNFGLVFRSMFSLEEVTVTDINGNNVTVAGGIRDYTEDLKDSYCYLRKTVLNGDGPPANDNRGIVIGASNLAFTSSQYNLQDKYTKDTFDHEEGRVYTLEELSDKVRIKVTRTFVNISGGAKDIYEFGLICWLNLRKYGTIFLISRIVLDTPITVGDGDGITINYYIAIPK